MARKRMIDPDFWSDEAVGALSLCGRLLFMGLISQADDEGRLRGNPALIRSQLFPYDEDVTASVVSQELVAIERVGLIVRYAVDGQQFIWVRNFSKHQTINKPTASKLPPPPDVTSPAPLPEDYGSTPVAQGMEAAELACGRGNAPLPEDYGSATVGVPPKRREEKGREEKGNTTTPTGVAARPSNPSWELLEAACDVLGIEATDYGGERDKQLAAAKRLLKKHSTDDVIACLRWLHSDEWRRSHGIDLMTVEQNMARWIGANRPTAMPAGKGDSQQPAWVPPYLKPFPTEDIA